MGKKFLRLMPVQVLLAAMVIVSQPGAAERPYERTVERHSPEVVRVTQESIKDNLAVKPTLATEEKLRLGERMYREGVLPSGIPMQATAAGNPPIPGATVACMSCHQRSGLGVDEEGVYTPATNGAKLFQPFQPIPKMPRTDQNTTKFLSPHSRPAYTDETLAGAIRSGIDPDGRVLDEAMPRYPLGDEDMAIMISYLKSLSSQFSPGVSDASLRLATVIADDVSREDRDAMLGSLLGFIDARNNQARSFKQLSSLTIMGGSVRTAIRQVTSLSVWLLKGPPETWRGQLEEYNRKEPAFALIGGITRGEWKPIHRFSEDNRIPCLFPDTDFPVISRTDWYTLYMSKGYYQEGEAAARYLNDREEILKGKPIVQIVRDSREGRALSAGFQETWQDLGHGAPVTLTVKPGEAPAEGIVRQLLAKEKPVAVVLWDGPAALPELEALAAGENRPEMVFVSARYLGKDLWALKEPVRDFAYITYPFRLSPPPQDKINPRNPLPPFSAKAAKEDNQAYAITKVMARAMTYMEGNYYRDNFLDVIGMMRDIEVPLYERLSFGPGQRYASRGCYIVQLSKGEKPELVKKSGWIIP